jgi:hypothetical protein
MTYHSLHGFSDALGRAARDFLAGRGVPPSDDYRLRVEECPVHGPGCARVVYGALRDHVVWARANAAEVAAALLETMLPRVPVHGDGGDGDDADD